MKEEGSNMKSYPLKILHGEKKQHRQILAKQTNKTWSIFHKRDNHCFFSDKENFRNISVKSFFRFCGALTREKCINGVPRAKKYVIIATHQAKKRKGVSSQEMASEPYALTCPCYTELLTYSISIDKLMYFHRNCL